MKAANKLTRSNSPDKRQAAERGVIIPIVAVTVGGILFILGAFSVDTNRVKTAQAQALSLVEEVCSLGAKRLPVASDVVASVDSAVQEVLPSYNINPYTEVDELRFYVPTPDSNIPTVTPALPGGSTFFSTLGTYSCSRCKLGGDVDAAEVRSTYPTGFMNKENFNGYLLCSMDVTVDTLVRGSKTVNVKTAYGLDVMGARNNVSSFEGAYTLLIDLAAEDVRLSDQKFEFTPGAFGGYDPLYNFDPGPAPFTGGVEAFGYHRLPMSYGGKQLTGNAAFQGNDRKMLLKRCYNPFVASRNKLLQYLVERMSRFWKSRNRTSILMLNPRHRDMPYPGDPNPPTTIVGLGQDMMQPQFELPFVNYKDDGTKNGAPGDPTVFKWLCPFLGASNCSAIYGNPNRVALQTLNMVTASQVRDCFSVNNGSNGIFTYDTDAGIDSPNLSTFEPGTFRSRSQVDPSYGAGDPWQQVSSAYFVNASESMRVLGMVEDCPLEMAGCTKELQPERDVTRPPNGLKGDIVAGLNYVNQVAGAFTAPGSLRTETQPMPALSSTTDSSSHVLLFLTKRLDPPDSAGNPSVEMSRIQAAMDVFDTNDITAERSVTVVFMPTDLSGLDPAAMADLRWAFKAGPGSRHHVFIVAPEACIGIPEDQCFRDFWENLLTSSFSGTSARHVDVLAENIFRQLVRSELKL